MSRFAALCGLAITAAACSDKPVEPWNAAKMRELSEQFGHIAEAYAVVDVCIPIIDANKDAKRSVISKIEVRRYSQLSMMNTEAELAKFFAYYRQHGGTDEQAAALDRIYRESHQAAVEKLGSIDSCAETVSDYANTIIQTKAGAVP